MWGVSGGFLGGICECKLCDFVDWGRPEGISALYHGFWGEHLVAFWPISCILGRICKRFGRSDGFWTEFGRISVISHGFGWNIWKHFCPSQGRGGRLECNLWILGEVCKHSGQSLGFFGEYLKAFWSTLRIWGQV